MNRPLTAEEILRWHLEAGVDETIGESPVDRYAAAPPDARVAPPPRTRADAPPVIARPATVPSPARQDEVRGAAARLANAAASLDELRLAMEGFTDCALRPTASRTIFADGVPTAKVMVVGEAPGDDEDRIGRPFVGAGGRLLDRMLASIGLDRSRNVYITNVVPWRPPGNRKPTPVEVGVCLPFLERHIELVDPELLLLFGGAAASALLATSEPISRLRGRWLVYSSPGLPRPIPAIATYPPSFLLQTPAQKRDAWRDLLAVRKRLKA